MRYGRDSFYRIDGFSPLGEGMGGQGFMIHLDPDHAKRFYETELNEKSHDRLQDLGKRIIVSSGFDEDLEYLGNPFGFIKNDKENLTFLLWHLTVPGNACGLGFPGHELDSLKSFLRGERERIEYWVEYEPHNVDTRHQSYCLLSLWLAWANMAEASAIPI